MTQTSQKRFCVVGSGAWGTVLALLLTHNAHDVTLWTRREEHAETLRRKRCNEAYLPGVFLPEALSVTANLSDCAAADALIIAVPSRALREVLTQLPPVPALISATKGLEHGTLKRSTQIIAEYQPHAILGALSGPNLAAEIAAGKPAASVLASNDDSFATEAQTWFNQDSFRIYRSADITGVELAGALKNILALATGMSDALGLGENTRATIITRGLAELLRLGDRLGADPKTFYGLAGLGDIVATCASSHSRNHRAGEALVRGESLADIQAAGLTAEGIPTVKAVQSYATETGLELPICSEVYSVVYEGKAPETALNDLMRRELKAE